MHAATRPPPSRNQIRALRVDVGGAVQEVPRARLFDGLGPHDILIFNDAATLPASLPAVVGGVSMEVRLAGPVEDGHAHVVAFGPGSWRQDTDDRPAPPPVAAGDQLVVAGLRARVVAISPISPRLFELRFDGPQAEILEAIYRRGRAVQYSHLADPLDLWSVQTIWAGRPWAVEMPSAGRSFTWAEVGRLRGRGVAIETLTHAAGLSATGDPRLDAALPLPERYEIAPRVVDAIATAKQNGGRVVAVGTSVTRALEGSVRTWGGLRAGVGVTDLRLGPGTRRRIVDAIVTGIHGPGESHYELLACFVDDETLRESHAFATRAGLSSHEFGDVALMEGTRANYSTEGVTPISSTRWSAPSTASISHSM